MLNGAGAWVDAVLVAVIVVSLIVGWSRGLAFEVLSLVGWFAAYFGAQWLAPVLAPHVPWAGGNANLRYGAAFVVLFVVILLAWGLLARALRAFVRGSKLSGSDRALGGAFGALRGVVLLLAVATALALTPLAESPAWQKSSGATWLQSALRGLKPVLPGDLSRHLPPN